MVAKSDYSFEPIGTVESSTPVAEAVPTAPTESQYAEEENPSDFAIMIGCGILGWMIG